MTTLKFYSLATRVAMCLMLAVPAVALAFDIQFNSDKTEAKIYCNNGDLAGTFYWNGTLWSNGVNSGSDINALARKQVKIAGSECK